MSKEKLGLYQKIFAVYQDIEYLKKDDKVEFNNTKYSAISEEKVTVVVRDSLIKNRLILLPVEQEHKKEGNLSTVDTKYKLIDIDTGEYEIIVSSGTGADSQDKGVGKAMTYAYKYLFLRTFAIPTGEDPDKVSSAELDEKLKQQNQPTRSNNNQPPKTNGKPASDAQLNKIDILLNQVAQKSGITKQVAYDTMKKKMSTTTELENFTMTQASQAIKILETATAGAA